LDTEFTKEYWVTTTFYTTIQYRQTQHVHLVSRSLFLFSFVHYLCLSFASFRFLCLFLSFSPSLFFTFSLFSFYFSLFSPFSLC
jgi:hypothetical protein